MLQNKIIFVEVPNKIYKNKINNKNKNTNINLSFFLIINVRGKKLLILYKNYWIVINFYYFKEIFAHVYNKTRLADERIWNVCVLMLFSEFAQKNLSAPHS